jgi:hypothetical protein
MKRGFDGLPGFETRHIAHQGHPAFVQQAAHQHAVEFLQNPGSYNRIIKIPNIDYSAAQQAAIGQYEPGPETQPVQEVEFLIKKELPVILMYQHIHVFGRAKLGDIGVDDFHISAAFKSFARNVEKVWIHFHRIDFPGAETRHMLGKQPQAAACLHANPVLDICAMGIQQPSVGPVPQFIVVDADECQQIIHFTETLFGQPVHYIHTVRFGCVEILSIFRIYKKTVTMNHSLLFTLANIVAMLAWAALVLAPRRALTRHLVLSGAVLLTLAAAYLIAILASLPGSGGNFASLEGVMELFSQPGAVLAGWLHYLAFDLFVGLWIHRDASRNGIRHFLTVPALLLTFMLGPAGLLTYLATKRLVQKRWSHVFDPVD